MREKKWGGENNGNHHERFGILKLESEVSSLTWGSSLPFSQIASSLLFTAVLQHLWYNSVSENQFNVVLCRYADEAIRHLNLMMSASNTPIFPIFHQ